MTDEEPVIADEETLDVADDVIDGSDSEVVSRELSTSSKEKMRQRLQADVEAFLKNGGKIQAVSSNVLADPPKKPESKYGGQRI